jgi:N6-adenosine-specific RNA methylase IME4
MKLLKKIIYNSEYSPQTTTERHKMNTDKKYQVIYADPAWQIRYLKETKKGINDYDVPYDTMTDEEIMALPIKDIADENAILFMWVVDKTLGFVWYKRAKNTNGQNSIMSKYVRKSCELCFIGTKGRYIVKDSTVEQFISAVKGRHSEKPKEVYSRIERMVGDVSRIELFARCKRQGWDVWGNQTPKYTEMTLGGNSELLLSVASPSGESR